MPISFRRSVIAGSAQLVPALLLGLFLFPASQAIGQDSTTPETPLEKQFDRVDFSIVAAGSISDTVSGIEQRDAHIVTTGYVPASGASSAYNFVSTSSTLLTIKPSSTVGELATLRYTAKPWIGFEFNFSNTRLTQNYNFLTSTSITSTTVATPPVVTTTSSTSNPGLLPGGVQVGFRELTLGYVAHIPYRPFGIQPFVGAGGGTVRFTPTPGGGQHVPEQYRAAYYYSAGLEDNFPGSHFGMRLGFRQLIYLAPDFQQNYLTIGRRLRTSEPIVGFFVRF